MFLSPAGIVLSWFRGLLSIGLIVGGCWLIYAWYTGLPETIEIPRSAIATVPGADGVPGSRSEGGSSERYKLSPFARVTGWRPGFDRQTTVITFGVLLLSWSVAGRYLNPVWLFAKPSQPRPKLPTGRIRRIARPDGSELHLEERGSDGAPTVILTHGWSLNSRQWEYQQSEWGDQFRIVVWDLPGLGRSRSPDNSDFSLEKMARDLHAVIEASGARPVILAGYSVGGMIILTFCRLFPELLGTRVSKLVLIHTTYTNPLKTMFLSPLFTALQKPVIEPLLYLQIGLWPLVWLMNWLSYWNGSLHQSVERTGFGGNGTRSDIDFVAGFYPLGSPAVLARGALAMLAFDATATLPTIKIPVLIVGAQQDPITTVQASQKMHSDLPAGELWTLDRAKHFGLIEYHSEVARRTAQFCLSRSDAGDLDVPIAPGISQRALR